MILLTFLCLQWLHGRVWLVGGHLQDWYYQCCGQPEEERIWKTLPPDCTLLRGRGETSFSGLIPLNVAHQITDYTAGSILAFQAEMVAKPSLHQGMCGLPDSGKSWGTCVRMNSTTMDWTLTSLKTAVPLNPDASISFDLNITIVGQRRMKTN